MALSNRQPFNQLGTCRFLDVVADPTGTDPVLYRKGSQIYLANGSLEQVAYIRKTAAYALTVSDARVVGADTTALAFNLTLPASPSEGMEWMVFDGAAAGSWHTNNLTLVGVSGGSGKQIVIAGAAAANTVAFSSRSGSFVVRYHATSDRWHVTAQSSSGAAPGAHASSHLAGGADPLLAAPGAIGGTTPAAGTFTALTVNTSLALAAGADVSVAAGASDIDWSLSTGFFKFPTGHIDWAGAAGTQVTLTQGIATSGSPYAVKVVGGAHTTLAASTEANDVYFDLSRTVQFATGALTTQRAFLIDAPTYAFVGASTITDAATFALSGPPTAGANATITNLWTLWVQAGASRLDGGVSLAGTAPAAAADKVQLGVDDLNGATTAALKMLNEGGGSLLMRMMSTAGAGKLAFYDQDVADDAEIELPTLANGGFILVTASPEGGIMHLAADGTCTVIVGSTNFVNTDTDTKLCVYDAGANGSVKNRLGSSKRVTAILLGS